MAPCRVRSHGFIGITLAEMKRPSKRAGGLRASLALRPTARRSTRAKQITTVPQDHAVATSSLASDNADPTVRLHLRRSPKPCCAQRQLPRHRLQSVPSPFTPIAWPGRFGRLLCKYSRSRVEKKVVATKSTLRTHDVWREGSGVFTPNPTLRTGGVKNI